MTLARNGIVALGLTLWLAGSVLAQEREVRLTFLGDAGTGDSKQILIRDQMLRFRTSHVFLLGDNIYSSGQAKYFGPRFDQVYAPLMQAGTRFHAALGNHDVDDCESPNADPLAAGADAYLWRRLQCDAEDHLNHAPFGYVGARRYYSVVLPTPQNPLLEVFVLDSNTLNTSQSKLPIWREDKAQVEWLDLALGASRARWKVVMMHHPPQSPTTGAKYFFFVPLGEGRAREYKLDQQLGPILQRHGVDVVMTGHNHFYARMVPQKGIRYFVSGGGGRKVYPFVESPGYVASGEGDFYHFLYVKVTDRTFEFYAIDSTGLSRDAGWFAKGDPVDHMFPPGTLPAVSRPARP
jgi:hypothetical protein